MKYKYILLFVLVVCACLLLAAGCNNYGNQITFSGTQVYYTAAVTTDDVDRLGNFLISSGFADGNEKSVQLNKSGNVYEFRMVVKKGIETDAEYRELGKLFAAQISENVFEGANVETHYCDEKFNTLIVLPMSLF